MSRTRPRTHAHTGDGSPRTRSHTGDGGEEGSSRHPSRSRGGSGGAHSVTASQNTLAESARLSRPNRAADVPGQRRPDGADGGDGPPPDGPDVRDGTAGDGSFDNTALRDSPSFEQEYGSILDDLGLDRAEHDRMRLSPTDDLTSAERAEVVDVRSRITAEPGQVMTKVLHPDVVDAYLDNATELNGRPFDGTQVGGSVARGTDVADLQTPGQVRDGLGLDDGVSDGTGWSPVQADAEHAYQLRYQQPPDAETAITFGGRSPEAGEEMRSLSGGDRAQVWPAPFLGTGYTVGGGVPEFLTRATDLNGRAEIWQLNRDGSERMVGVLDDSGRWTRTPT